MPEYAKKTNAELQEILKSRGLATSGKKAELIARLNENDKETEASASTPLASTPIVAPADSELVQQPSNDTAAVATISEPEPTPALRDSVEQVVDPIAATTGEEATDNPSPDTSLANQTNYSLNLPTSTVDNELAKRKARAERFGIIATTTETEPSSTAATTEPSTASDVQALRNLERAKRFGTSSQAIGKLDEALSSSTTADAANPQRASRKRGHNTISEPSELDDPGLKRSFVNRAAAARSSGGRSQRRGGTPGTGGVSGAGKPQGIQKSSRAAPAYTSEKDKLAAEARKKKFATA